MFSVMSLIEKHADLNIDTVEWMHTLAFSDISNSDDNPMWDESINGPQK